MLEHDAKRSHLYWKVLATSLHQERRYPEALRIYRQAILLNPEDADLSFNLGNLLRTIGQNEKAIGAYEHAHRLNAADTDILSNLAPLYRSCQRWDDARLCYEKILQLNPDDPSATHFLSALNGEAPAQAPAGYVIELFDHYASNYDQHMGQVLLYRGPELLCALLMSHEPARLRRFKAADLGCGTGLSGEAFEHLITEIDGFDLSAGMLEKAEKKAIYRQLWQGDCAESLQKADVYDLFIVADLIPYIGKLENLFAAIREKAKSPAYIVLSAEDLAEGDEPRLQLTGRYQHSRAYMQMCIDLHGMKLLSFKRQVLRQQGNTPIQAGLYLIEV